jgi:hypothetical protein
LKFVLLEKILRKIMVSHNLRQAHHLLEVGMTKNLKDHETLSKVRHVGLHVDFLYAHEVFFGPSGLHLCV